MKSGKYALVGSLLTVIAGAVLPANAALFGSLPTTSDTDLVVVDPRTGMATTVGPIGVPDVQGLAGRQADLLLFGASGSSGQILTVDPATATGTPLGSPDGLPITGLAFSPGGVLYATCTRASLVAPDTLCTINQDSGMATAVGTEPLERLTVVNRGFDGLAFDAGGTLYTSTRATALGGPQLYTVNLSTGQATAVGAIRDADNAQITSGVVGLSFEGSSLYGSTEDGRIITIDPGSGVYSPIGAIGLPGAIEGLASLDLPTPTPTQTGPAGPAQTVTPAPGACTEVAPQNPCVPGGDRTATDCFLEFLVTPVPTPNRKAVPRNRLVCYEGDPTCDFDSDLNNASCTFHVALCLNNSDPRLSCSPYDVASIEVRSPNPARLRMVADATNLAVLEGQGADLGVSVVRGLSRVFLGTSNPQPNVCSGPLDITVPLRQLASGRLRARTSTLRIKATNSLGQMDLSGLSLGCKPSKCGDGKMQSNEQCDDGNRINGDGCDQGCNRELATATPAVTATATSTNTPASNIPTPAPTATATSPAPPSATATSLGGSPAPTLTPTQPHAAVCGDGVIEAGETCDDGNTQNGDACPPDCRIVVCSPDGTTTVAAVSFTPPTGTSVGSLTVFVEYPDGVVQIPGSGGDASVGSRITDKPSGFLVDGFDYDYAVRVALAGSRALIPGQLFRVNFDHCQGAGPPDVADFHCTVEEAFNTSFQPVSGVTCSVSLP